MNYSKIVRDVADNTLAVFAGETLDTETVSAHIETTYALLRGGRRMNFTPYMNVLTLMESNGMKRDFKPFTYETVSYTFPAA